MAWDPSIILSAKQYTGPDPNETMRTLGQLMLMKSQQQQHEASLADLLNQRSQAQALQGVYASTPRAQWAGALAQKGFGPQTFAAEDQDAQQQKAMSGILQQYKEQTTKLLYGTKDQADYEKRLSSVAPQQRALFPQTWDEAKPLVEAIAIPPEKRAELADKDKIRTETERHDRAIEATRRAGGVGGIGAGGDLSDDAVEAEAQKYVTTGQLTQLGMGKAAGATKAKILNRAAAIAQESGADLSANKAGYKADSASLAKLQLQADSTEAFESTALKNLDTALGAASKVVNTGSPLFNAPLQKWAEMTGDPNVSAKRAALLTAQTEISKVLSGAMGSAVSDSARHEAQELLKSDSSLAQLNAAADILKKDMANRKEAVAAGIKEIRGRTGFKKAGGTGGAGGAAMVTVRRKADGKTKTLSADDAAQVLVDPAYEQVP